jgi:hypothetical protein
MLRRFAVFTVCFVLVLPFVPSATATDAAPPSPPVKLAVMVVFDQLRGDYLTRWNDLFGDGGFHRLEKDGAWFQNCNYPYAGTVTGAGHASLATGCSPCIHGVFANEWYDRTEGRVVYCATSPKWQRVPPTAADAKNSKKVQGGAPERLLAPTLADALKEATGGKGHVVSLSSKDRGAVFTGGKKPDACYWIDGATGQAITSTYYRDHLEDWVTAFNKEKRADRWFGKDWPRLRKDIDYEKYSGPDDAPGESLGYSNALQGRTFPHPMDGGLKQPGKAYYELLYASPFGNELLLDLVDRAVDAEKLGAHEAPDLLCVSFSCTDPIGHAWGPDSQEVLDGVLRADLIVKGLLDLLDAKVGKGRYVLVLSADHGVCPLPEASRKQGRDAGRIPATALKTGAEDFLQKTFGKKDDGGQAIEKVLDQYIYLNRAWLKGHDLEQSRVEAALAKWFTQQRGIEAAYTRTELTKEMPADDVIGQKVKRSFYPERSGDVVIVPKPYYLITDRLTGTTHGSPHSYDTHVPLLVYGPGVRAGVRGDAVTPQAAVPILAHALGIKPPADAECGVPEKLFVAPKDGLLPP